MNFGDINGEEMVSLKTVEFYREKLGLNWGILKRYTVRG